MTEVLRAVGAGGGQEGVWGLLGAREGELDLFEFEEVSVWWGVWDVGRGDGEKVKVSGDDMERWRDEAGRRRREIIIFDDEQWVV